MRPTPRWCGLLLILALAPGAAWATEGYVGVALAAVPAEEAAAYGVQGPAVGAAGVVPDGPAHRSGLRQGDLVTSVDGKPVATPEAAVARLKAHAVGDKVRIGLVHLQEGGGRLAIEIAVVVAPKPAGYGAPGPAPGAPSPAAPATRAAAAGAAGGLHLVDAAPVQGSREQRGHCTALVPPGWSMRAGPNGDTADLDGPGGRAHAAWGIRGVDTAMAPYYGPMYGPPDAATLATASFVAHGQARFTGASRTVGQFTARDWQAGATAGTALWAAYPGPGPGQYVLSSFLAWADGGGKDALRTARAVMLSIDCQTQLHASEQYHVTARRDPPGGQGRGRSRGDLEDYNAQLGTQWATSPTTGEHYQLDAATQWNDTGPDGPGYYRKAGNGYEKLQTGWK